MQPVNLLSDTQTRPTDPMRRAIASAEVGDEQKLDDPTTLALQERVAELLGHEAALLLPSGSMCNLIGFRLHLRPGGDEVILAANSHPVGFEAGAPAAINGAMTHQIQTSTGVFGRDDLTTAIRPAGDRYAPRSRLVSIEQTTNMGGGRVWPLDAVAEVVGIARENGLRAHLDGARLMNAAVASGNPAAAFAGDFDTAWIDFTKGLGAPVGAVLAGTAELIAEAWRYKQMLGGAFRQSGMLAAGCLHALDHHVERLADDHRRARTLADGLAAIPGVELDPAIVETNIVIVTVLDPPGLIARLAQDGVLVGPAGPGRVRAVTHLDVDDGGIERALTAFQAALAA